MELYIPTGNEVVSLPTINEETAAIESVSFLYMAQKGMIELRGSSASPLMTPFVQQILPDGRSAELALTELGWHREHDWIPQMTARAGDIRIDMTVLAPVGERGFALRLSVRSDSPAQVRFGLRGCWSGAWHCVNEDKELEGTKHCYRSGWNNSIVFDFRCGGPLFAFAPMADRDTESRFSLEGGAVRYSLSCNAVLSAGPETVTFFWGLGFEEVAAATSAKEMLRRSWEWEYTKTAAWLDHRAYRFADPRLSRIYNTNLFFCIFYSTGITLDTEELVCITSRSSRYYVSAAYWDRDTLLWAFPAILEADPPLARQMLEYVFTKQRRNIGTHSRYIDGTVLEPGFELDELMAPVLALDAYIRVSGDRAFLSESFVRDSLRSILKKLEMTKAPDTELYETFLQPTDDEHVYPYLCYDNVLVWAALNKLSALMPDEYGWCAEKAARVRQAVYNNFVFADGEGKKYFGWSVDLAGNHDVYDEPPGSLQLLPYYGFCDSRDEIWLNTVEMIRSADYPFSFAGMPVAEIGCPHAPYPWLLSLCNSLLSGHARQAWRELEVIKLDNDIACESVDPVTGECRTGAAFATCAGFLCHAMRTADREMLP